MALREVAAPTTGLWRVGRSPDPLDFGDLLAPALLQSATSGNRFDSPLAMYRVCYFGTTLEACFGETLARFRPDLSLRLVAEEEGFMRPGEVPADWRHRRLAVQATIVPSTLRPNLAFLDVEELETREVLRAELADILAFFGHRDLDVATVRGADRRVTRWISQWAHDQRRDDGTAAYAGIRYLSRLTSEWECWAIFEGVGIEELLRQSVRREDEALARVATRFDLIVF